MPSGKPIANRAEVIAAMDGTRTAQDIADQFGIARPSVYSIYLTQHSAGAPVKLKPAGRRRRDGASESRIAQLMRLADGTRTRPEIAAAMGVTMGGLGSFEARARIKGHDPKTKRFDGRPNVKWQKVAEFCADGTKTRQQVADHFKLTLDQLAKFRSNIRNRRKVELRFADDGAARPRAVVRVNGIVDALPDHVREWLTAQVPAGAEVADMIRAIIVDQYHDEVDAQQAAALAQEVRP